MPELSEMGAFARRHDPDRFLCALFAPAARREAVFALIAFNHELARAREVARTPIAALVRLQWWREVVEGAARRHEVATPLRAAIDAGALHAADLGAMVDAREVEAEETAVADRAAFDAYLAGTAGGWAVAAARCSGAPPVLLPAVRAAGAAYGLAGVLRSVPALAGQGRSLLPADLLASWPASSGGDAAVGVRRALAGTALSPPRRWPRGVLAAVLPLALARRDLRRLKQGHSVPERRGGGDRLAVVLAGISGWA